MGVEAFFSKKVGWPGSSEAGVQHPAERQRFGYVVVVPIQISLGLNDEKVVA